MSPLVVLALSLSIWCAPAPDESVPQDVQRLYREFEYQRKLPLPEPTEGEGEGEGDASPRTARPAQGDTWSADGWPRAEELRRREDRGRARERGARTRRPPEMRAPSGGLGGFEVLLEMFVWVVLAVVAATVIASLVRGWGRRERTIAPEVEAGEPRPGASFAGPRAEAEALAAQGRYAEAVHVLLLRTIEVLAATRDRAVPDAWTSREIQREAPMPAAARSAFGVLVDTVEDGLFAGRPVDEPAWTRCRERFSAFEAAYRTGRP